MGQMVNLKVLKIEHNPLTWPPLEYLQPEQESDHEVWLTRLREYLTNNDPPVLPASHPSLSVPLAGMSSPMIASPHRNSILSLNCRTLVHTFLATYQNKMQSVSQSTPQIDAYLSILYASVEIYQVTNYTLMLGSIEMQVEINHLNQASLVVLKLLKDLLDQKSNTSDIKIVIKSLISSTKDVVKKLLRHVQKQEIVKRLDSRLVQGMLSDWSKIIQILVHSLESLGVKTIEPSDQRFEYLLTLLSQVEDVVDTMEQHDQNAYEKAMELARNGDPKCLDWLLQFLMSCKNQMVLQPQCAQLALEAQHLITIFQ